MIRSISFVAFALVAACGSTTTITAGSTCDAPSDVCATGTTCLVESVTLLQGCSSSEKLCTIVCTTNDACITLLGDGARCSDACDGTFSNVCVPPE